MVIKCCKGRCLCCDEVDFEYADSVDGFSRFCNDWNKWRRLMWFLICLASLGLLGEQLYERFSSFLRYETKTTITFNATKTLTLPTVTLCNMNMFSRAQLKAMDYDLLENVTEALIDDFEETLKNSYNNDDWVTLPPGKDWKELWWLKTKKYEDREIEILASYNVTNFTVSDWLKRTGWQLNVAADDRNYSAILSCRVGKTVCRANKFATNLSPDGLCYSFNSKEADRAVQKFPGTDAGLLLLVDMDEDDYTHYSLAGMGEFGSGLRVFLHEWYEGVDLGKAVGVPSGGIAIVGARKHVTQTENSPPWSSCSSQSPDSPSLPYSQRNCLLHCEATATVALCGCRLWYQPSTAGEECGVARSTSCISFKKILDDTSTFDACANSCTSACEETTYQYGTSFTQLTSAPTSARFIEGIIKLMGIDGNEEQAEGLNSTFVENNVISLQIGFSQLNVEISTSSPATGFSAFISDLGGVLGLFTGMSAISIFQLLEYPIAKTYSIVKLNAHEP